MWTVSLKTQGIQTKKKERFTNFRTSTVQDDTNGPDEGPNILETEGREPQTYVVEEF